MRQAMTPMQWFVRFMGLGLLTIAVVFGIVWTADAVEPEEGATFDGGICWEADGTEGLAGADGQCITPADYDLIFGFENLSQTPSISECVPGNPECTVENGYKSIAEVYEITPEDEPASDRPIGTDLVPEDEDHSFKVRVERAHSPHAPIPD